MVRKRGGKRQDLEASRNKVGVYERRQRVKEIMFEKPLITQEEMAVRLGVSPATICKDVRWVWQTLLHHDRLSMKKLVELRTAQYLYGLQLAVDGFLRSQQNETEIKTTIEPKPCLDCNGSGNGGGGKACGRCDGEGVVQEETTIKRVRGQAGDPAFLREYREALIEVCRLEGLDRKGAKEMLQQINIDNRRQTIDLSGASDDALRGALRTLDKLRIESSRRPDPDDGDDGIIDVEAER